jgi:transposase
MSEVKKGAGEIKTMDISGEELIKQRAEAMEKKMATRRQAMIELIMRQTDYTEEVARIKLEYWKNNYLHVIKEYMDPNFQDKEKAPEPSTKNQMIYGEIRTFMDGVNKQQLQRKRRTEQLEQRKAAYIAYVNKLQKEVKDNN